MSTPQAPAKLHFFLKRLHSLTGLALCGFILEHFFTNSASIHALSIEALGLMGDPGKAQHTFNTHVAFLHSLPFLPLIEVGALLLPFAFHTFYGFYFMTSGKTNIGQYPYEHNFAYIMQRVSAVVITLFLVVHVAELRFGWNMLPRDIPVSVSTVNPKHKIEVTETRYVEDQPSSFIDKRKVDKNDYYSHVQEYFVQMPFIGLALYFLGILATAFHFANGIYLAGINWGIWIRRDSQKMAFMACMGMMIILGAVGTLSLVGFRS